MKAADHLNMPELIFSNVEVEMSEKEKQMYDGLKADLIIPLEGGDIDAQSAVGLSNSYIKWQTVLCMMRTGKSVGSMTGS